MNPGGIRGGPHGFLFTPSGGEQPGEVTYGEAFTVQRGAEGSASDEAQRGSGEAQRSPCRAMRG